MADKLRQAAQALIDRWDSPAWGGSAENLRHTGEYITALRAALDQPALAQQPAVPPEKEPSPTAGMNIAQRILHVGGRNNAAGYVEFGSIQAVQALVRQVLRDIHKPRLIPDHELVTMYDECPRSDSEMLEFAHNVMGAMLNAAPEAPERASRAGVRLNDGLCLLRRKTMAVQQHLPGVEHHTAHRCVGWYSASPDLKADKVHTQCRGCARLIPLAVQQDGEIEPDGNGLECPNRLEA